MSPVKRLRVKAARRRRTSSNKVRFVRGRIRLHVAGYSGLESFSPFELIRHIGVSNLCIAAKKVLRLTKQATDKKKKKARRKIGKTRRKRKT
jgi:hypothetical protein